MALTRRALPAAWTLRHVGGDSPVAVDGVPATVPGCVHTDLLAAGLIPDPFADANELAVAWVADADWEYRTAVDLTAVEGHDRAELVFHGLDTLATVSLDGAVVAETENMHRTYRVDVTGRRGRAAVAVRFRSATREAEARRQREGDWPSSSFGRPFNYVRKMACSWGWDWGPWLTTAGIWRAAELVGWDVAAHRLGPTGGHDRSRRHRFGHRAGRGRPFRIHRRDRPRRPDGSRRS